MRLRDLFRWRTREPVRDDAEPAHRREFSSSNRLTAEQAAYCTEVLEAMESGRLNPPKDLRSPAAWDEYSANHVQFGAMERGLSDGMASDPLVPHTLRARGARRVLCAGNGLSVEAFALFLFGFDVVALDISGVPGLALSQAFKAPDSPLHRIARFTMADDGTISCPPPQTLNIEHCPQMHKSERGVEIQHSDGGTLRLVTGDLFDADVCPGPFDAVIERRTLQLYPAADMTIAVDRLIARLADRAMFITQKHDGCGRPGKKRSTDVERVLAQRGFVSRHHSGNNVNAPRLSYPVFTSG